MTVVRTKMNPEIKDKWLTALRSGEYRQGQNVLKQQHGENDTPQYCCLGVLCDIAVKEGLDITVRDIHEEDEAAEKQVWEFGTSDSLSHELLPDAVMEWAGMDSDNPTVYDPSARAEDQLRATDIATLNDNGISFEDIADVIEAEL